MTKLLITDGMEKSAVDKLKQYGMEITEQFFPEDELKEQIKNYQIDTLYIADGHHRALRCESPCKPVRFSNSLLRY